MDIPWVKLLILVVFYISDVTSQECASGCTCYGDHMSCEEDSNLPYIPTIPSDIKKVTIMETIFPAHSLDRRNLSSMSHVTELTLKGCGLREIGYQAFIDMTELVSLDLSMNNIGLIAVNTFTGLRLDYMYLNENPGIRFTNSVFQNMTTEHLDMSKNNIERLSANIFLPLKSRLKKLLLNGNSIEQLPKNMVNVFDTLDMVRLYENPLICDCQMKWLKQFYDENKGMFRTQGNNEPRCASPTHLRGQFFNRLSVGDFSCDKPTLSSSISFTETQGILSCTSQGSPLPTVTWYRPNGIVLPSPPEPNSLINTNRIELYAHERDVTGRYSCIASNDGGNISLTIDVGYPFNIHTETTHSIPCDPIRITQTREIDISNKQTEQDNNSEDESLFKQRYFTLIDIIAAVSGTFLSTLIVTIVILHFCVYRKRALTPQSQYTSSPPISEYSSAGSDKNTHSPYHAQTINSSIVQGRPLPNKPYHKVPVGLFDENHYMSTNVDEQNQFLRTGLPDVHHPPHAPSIHCEACQMMNNSQNSHV